MSGDVQLRKRNKKTKKDLNDNSNDKHNERENLYRLTRNIGKVLFFIAFLIAVYILLSAYYGNYKRNSNIKEVRFGYIDKYVEEIKNNDFNDLNDFDDNDVDVIGSIQIQNKEFNDFDDHDVNVIGSMPIQNKRSNINTKNKRTLKENVNKEIKNKRNINNKLSVSDNEVMTKRNVNNQKNVDNKAQNKSNKDKINKSRETQNKKNVKDKGYDSTKINNITTKINKTNSSNNKKPNNYETNNNKKLKNQIPNGSKDFKSKSTKKELDILTLRIKEAESFIQKNSKQALDLFQKLLSDHPNNVQIKYGYAKTLDKRSEEKRSNTLLQNAIKVYIELLQNDISDELYLEIIQRCVERMRFLGHYKDLLSVHNQVIKRFQNDPKHRNDYAVTLLTVNRLNNAKLVLEETLRLWPDNGYAQVLYGFILKTKDNDLINAVKYLKFGIESKEKGVIDGRFFYHLGDALIRLGKREEAAKVHAEGAKNKLFLSENQRSLYNIDRLTSRPFWTIEQTPYKHFFKLLEDNWEIIRKEGLSLLDKEGYFKNDPENLKDLGQWKQLELYSRGMKIKENCKKCPATCKIIESFSDARNCRRGQVKYSVMHPGTHVWPHCGPTNCRIRSHLGLKVPKNTYLRVVDEIKSWEEGKILIFDDSFEHEVWHNGTDIRLVLIVDIWHPELTEQEKHALPSI